MSAWAGSARKDVGISPSSIISQDEYVKSTIEDEPRVYENLKKNGLPDSLLFENYRKRFNYHIVPEIEMEDVDLTQIAVIISMENMM